MVRLAQEFNMRTRHPPGGFDLQGNFGSVEAITGAMLYTTEARLLRRFRKTFLAALEK